MLEPGGGSVVLRVRCPRCGEIVELRGGLFDVVRGRCPRCGAVVIARINIVVTAEYVDGESLREFEEWLVREKGLMRDTARRYARDVRLWVERGRWPPYTAPLEYWEEWKRSRSK